MIVEGSDGVIELTDEERSMLALEGYDVPMRLPLSNAEQKALKAVKRKIANKVCESLDYFVMQVLRKFLLIRGKIEQIYNLS